MAEQNIGAPQAPIRFDAPASTGAPGGDTPGATAPGALSCAQCATPIGAYYSESDGGVFCARCKRTIEEAQGAAAASGGFGRGALFGLGAALVGSAGYWAFIKITDLDWALISIAVAALVATAIRKGNGGRGSRRFQLLAVLLTYLAIGGAYAPFLLQGIDAAIEKGAEESPYAVEEVSSDEPAAPPAGLDSNALTSTGATVRDSLAKAAEARSNRSSPGRSGLLLVGAMVLLALASPIMTVMAGGFPGSAISVAIIGFALVKAWQMTGADATPDGRVFTGPYKVGARGPAS